MEDQKKSGRDVPPVTSTMPFSPSTHSTRVRAMSQLCQNWISARESSSGESFTRSAMSPFSAMNTRREKSPDSPVLGFLLSSHGSTM